MLDKIKELMKEESEETIKGVFLIAKGQIKTQIEQSKKVLETMVDKDKLNDEEKAAFKELDNNLDATGVSINKIIDIALSKIK